MPTGYEVQMYRDLATTAQALERLANAVTEAGDSAPVIEGILDAQADVQTALGMLRLRKRAGASSLMTDAERLDYVEDRLERSLAHSHALLARLGRPMAHMATHDEVEAGPTHEFARALIDVWEQAAGGECEHGVGTTECAAEGCFVNDMRPALRKAYMLTGRETR